MFAFFCLLGLLFLLMKEQYVTGYVEVRVTGEDLDHWTQVPVYDAEQAVAARTLVWQAQALAER